jgi:hypothetical protein
MEACRNPATEPDVTNLGCPSSSLFTTVGSLTDGIQAGQDVRLVGITNVVRTTATSKDSDSYLFFVPQAVRISVTVLTAAAVRMNFQVFQFASAATVPIDVADCSAQNPVSFANAVRPNATLPGPFFYEFFTVATLNVAVPCTNYEIQIRVSTP